MRPCPERACSLVTVADGQRDQYDMVWCVCCSGVAVGPGEGLLDRSLGLSLKDISIVPLRSVLVEPPRVVFSH